jgi:hypothetical protein
MDSVVDSTFTLHLSRSQLNNFLKRVGKGSIDHPGRHVVHLSERNVVALLSKLDRRAAGGDTACTILKRRQDGEVPFNQSIEEIEVTAVEDAEWDGLSYVFTVFNTNVVVVETERYYAAQQRQAGAMVDADEQRLPRPSIGIAHEDIL